MKGIGPKTSKNHQLMLQSYEMGTLPWIFLFKLCADTYYHRIYEYKRFKHITLKASVQRPLKSDQKYFAI